MRRPGVGLDTQCYTYLLDAVVGIEEPTDPLAEQRKALIRSWFYNRDVYFLTETVVAECDAIKDSARREAHSRFKEPLFNHPPTSNAVQVQARTAVLFKQHRKEKDCRVLAEAEDLCLTYLLTFDGNFRKRLGHPTTQVMLMTPSEYWARLAIPKGAAPKLAPEALNPLSMQTWWRW